MKGLVKRFNSFDVLDYASAFVKPTGREMRPEELRSSSSSTSCRSSRTLAYRPTGFDAISHTSVKKPPTLGR